MDLSKFNLSSFQTTSLSINQTIGQLTILATGVSLSNKYRYYAICQCSCGSPPKKIRIDGITSKVVTSCGCFQKKQTTKHGLSQTKLYTVWRHMMRRCYNKKDSAFCDYGGRGIKVCDQWHDVSNFVNDMKNGYCENLQIDRINNNGNYEPSNCRWATVEQNSNNKRSSLFFTFNGETLTIGQWAKKTNIKYRVLHDRLMIQKWDIKAALETPILSHRECGIRARAAQLKSNHPKS